MKNLYKLISIVFFMFVSILVEIQNVNAQQIVTIGNGTNTSQYLPAYGYYNYSWSAQIYSAADFNGIFGNITEIKFDVSNQVSTYQMNNQKVYFYLTSDSVFPNLDYIDPASIGATLVYDGSIIWDGSGWQGISLNSPFFYSGNKNLMILWENKDGSFANNYPSFYASSTINQAKYAYSDSNFPQGSGNLSADKANIQFILSPPLQIDLSVSQLINPSPNTVISPNNSLPITIIVSNYGTASQSNYTLKYSINGGSTFVTELDTTTITPGGNHVYTFQQTADMSNIGTYSFIAVVNIANDSNSFNDTLRANITTCVPKSGTYTIGKTGTEDYNTISSAISSLYDCGIVGPVVFEIDSGTYHENLYIGPINGASANNTITFKGSSIGTTKIVSSTTYSNKAAIEIDGAKHLIFDSLSVAAEEYNNESFWGFLFKSNSDSNKVINCFIDASDLYESYGVVFSNSLDYLSMPYDFHISDIKIENCVINRGVNAINMQGYYITSPNERLYILNNTFNNQSDDFVSIYFADSIVIKYNSFIKGPRTNNIAKGIFINGGLGESDISYNRINLSAGQGISLDFYNNIASSTGFANVYNNFISMKSNGNEDTYGISLNNSRNINFYNNSVSITGNSPNDASNAMFLGNPSQYTTMINIYNNILYNSVGGDALFSNLTTSQINSDYNNLYSNSDTLIHIAQYGGFADLASWTNTTAKDSNSLSVDPWFISDVDLHAGNSLINNVGIPITTVTDDIDGDVRNSTNPDIGADEFTPLAHNLGINLDISGGYNVCNHTNAEVFYVNIINYGTSTETSFSAAFKLDDNNIVQENINTTLATGDTLVYAFTQTLDLSVGGKHKLKVYVSLPSDANNLNDTLTFKFITTQDIVNFPLYENFETTSAYFHTENEDGAHSDYRVNEGNANSTGIYMTGTTNAGWNYYSNIQGIINYNGVHKASLKSCEVDATNLTSLILSFDLKQGYSYSSNNSWFFVQVNDSVFLKDVHGDSVWNSTDNDFENLIFDVSAFAGTDFSLSFNGYFRYGNEYGVDVDYAVIDNIRLWEPQPNDIGAVSIFASSGDSDCGLVDDSLYVLVENFGSNIVSGFPVNLVGYYGSTSFSFLNIICNDSIAPGEKIGVFMGTINSTDNGQTAIHAYTSLSLDPDNNNDTVNYSDYIEMYKPLPYIETFDNQNNLDWNLSSFYIYQEAQGNTTGSLVYNYNSQYGNNNSAVAMTNFNVGKIQPNSILTFKYQMYFNGAFNDTINFFVIPDCGAPTLLYTINSTTYYADNNFHTINIPVGNFAGSIVKYGVVAASVSNFDYGIKIDDFGILSPFSFSLGNDTTICYSDTYNINTGLSLDSGYHFVWHGPNVSSTDTLPYINVNTQGLYWVDVENNSGYIVTDSVFVGIYAPLQANLYTDEDVLCVGDSVKITPQFSGVFPIIMNWTDGSNNYSDTIDDGQYRYFTPSTTTQYKILSIVDSAQCSLNNPDSLIITVIPKQSITFSGLANQYCLSDAEVTLSASPVGGSFVGAGINNVSFSPIIAGTGVHNIIYTLVDTNNCISTDTLSTVVYNIPMVSIVSNIDSVYCSNNQSINLFAYPLGGSFSGDGINASTFNPSIANTGIDTIVYSYTDIHNCFNADTVITIVNASPIVNITTNIDSSYCENDNAFVLTASPSGGSFNGMGITDSTFNPSQAGYGNKMILYAYTDANGCSDYDTVYTEVNPLPTVIITSSLDDNYCINSQSININAYPVGGVFTGDGLTGSIFYPDSAGIGNHDIIYTYTDVNGCANKDTVSTTVNALPIVSLAAFNQVCANQGVVNLSGGTPFGGVYVGNNVNSSQGVFYTNNAPIGLNKIIYKYTDTLGCENADTNMIRVVGVPLSGVSIGANICKSDTAVATFTANVSPAATFLWDFDNANIISGTNGGPYQLLWDTIGVKNITVSVTDSGCVSNVAYNYTNVIDAIAVASLIGNDSACFGDNILMFANGGMGYSYQWFDTSNTLTSASDTLSYFTTSQTGEYYVKVTNDIGCSAFSNSIDIFVNPQITSDFSLPAIACKNDMVSVNYTGTSSASAQYIWDFDNGQIASGSAGGPYNIIWNVDSLKTVSLDVMENGCYAGITAHNIDILTTPAQITALGNTSFCEGGNVTLSANAGNYSYQWYKDNVAIATTPLYSATQSGFYKVQISDNNTNCSNISDSVQVVVNTTNFNIAFSANPTSFTIPPFNTTFNNQTSNANDYYWLWSFGDGNTSTFINPTHQYMFDGDYSVEVIAQNISTGCFDTLVKDNYISCTGGSANPCNLDATIANVGGNEVCYGDSVKLYSIDYTAGISYQWLKDGILISGATDSVYYAKQTGLYQLLLVDNTCSVFSQPFSLIQHSTVTPTIIANGNIVPCTNDSMELYVSTSFNSYQWSNGSSSSNIFVNNSGSFIVTVTDNNGCNASSAPYIVNASLLQAPEICIVGVDSATNHNRIVWERQANSLIDSFKVYRESTVAGVYDLIGTKAFSDLSVMEDLNSNPGQQAYRYRITAIDTCGMETPPSAIHKSIHLTINAGLNNVWNLIWTGYEGFNFGSYRIYRGSDSTQLTLLTQIQSTLTSYTDLNPPAGNVFYQIEVVSPHPCYPDSIFTKANTNYNTSRSNTANTNMAPNTGFVHSANNQLSMQVYPNPNKGVFTLEINSNSSKVKSYAIEVFNTVGAIIYQEEIYGGNQLLKQMHLETLSKGIYFIRLRSKDNVLNTRFIVE